MDIFETIYARRSIRYYDPAHLLTQSEEDKLIEAAMQTPSSFNIQHWRLVKISDMALRQQIRAASHDQAQLTEASLLLVICADVNAWEKEPGRYLRNAPQPVQEMLVPWIKSFYEGRPQVQRDEAIRSVGLIAQTLMLAAKGMGYDSCPMIGFDPDKVAQLIRLPQDHLIGMMLTIGKGIKPAWDKPGFIEKSEALIQNHF